MPTWPPPEYRIRARFRAPLPFVYRWCTDYGPNDARLAGDHYERRVLARTARAVVLEDLWWERGGWGWRRSEVTLRPPDFWHADSVGTVRTASIDYRLRALEDGGTELDLRMRRRPSELHPLQPSKSVLEQELRQMWARFGRELDRDHRRAVGPRPARVATGRRR